VAIDYAKRVKDWSTLEIAVGAKIEREFIQAVPRPTPAFRAWES
jgi:hypothetical protein